MSLISIHVTCNTIAEKQGRGIKLFRNHIVISPWNLININLKYILKLNVVITPQFYEILITIGESFKMGKLHRTMLYDF